MTSRIHDTQIHTPPAFLSQSVSRLTNFRALTNLESEGNLELVVRINKLNNAAKEVFDEAKKLDTLLKRIKEKIGPYKERFTRLPFSKSRVTDPLMILTEKILTLRQVLNFNDNEVKGAVFQSKLSENFYNAIVLLNTLDPNKERYIRIDPKVEAYKDSLKKLERRIAGNFVGAKDFVKCNQFQEIVENFSEKKCLDELLLDISNDKPVLTVSKKTKNSRLYAHERNFINSVAAALQSENYMKTVKTEKLLDLQLGLGYLLVNFATKLKKGETDGTVELINALYCCYDLTKKHVDRRNPQNIQDHLQNLSDLSVVIMERLLPKRENSFKATLDKMKSLSEFYKNFGVQMLTKDIAVEGYAVEHDKTTNTYFYYKVKGGDSDKKITDVVVLCKAKDSWTTHFNPNLNKTIDTGGWVHQPVIDNHQKVLKFIKTVAGKHKITKETQISFAGFGFNSAVAQFTAFKIKELGFNAQAYTFSLTPYLSPNVAGQVRDSGLQTTNIVLKDDKYTKTQNFLKNICGEFDQEGYATTFELPNFTATITDMNGHNRADYGIALNSGFKVLTKVLYVGHQIKVEKEAKSQKTVKQMVVYGKNSRVPKARENRLTQSTMTSRGEW